MPLQAAAFLGHGSPMNALESNRYTAAWRAFGMASPKPRAVLVVSAHWYIGYTAVTAMPRPRTIHDFFGFPQQLFDVQYPAPGAPEVAAEVADVVKPTHVGLDRDSWGLDHGSWSVLVHTFPNADVPVLQLSINAQRPDEWHVELGAKLAPLRQRGVMVLGSGNVVHNLRAIDWANADAGFDWARRFAEAARVVLTERPADVLELRRHPDFSRAVPTPEHFLPLLYLAGLARAAGKPLKTLIEGYALGSLSMDCYGLDAVCPPAGQSGNAAGLPDPGTVRPEETNT